MLRVLTLSTLFPDPSRPRFGAFVERQAQGLAEREGVEVMVAVPVGVPPFPLSLGHRHRHLPRRAFGRSGELATLWRRFRSLPHRPKGNPTRLAAALLPTLRDLHADRPFDVIDAQFFWPDGAAAMRIAGALGIPFSIKARGSDIFHWGKIPGPRAQMVEAANAAGGLLAVSEALRGEMIALGMPAERIAVHRTGIDRDLFKPRDRAAAKAALGVAGPLIASVGALIAGKGHELAIAAMARLPNATLLIAGEGPERRRLERAIAAGGLSDRARLLGGVPQERVGALLAAAEVMLLMSRSEGLANVWIEALACGTPIVVGDAGGASEVVTAREAGRIAAFDEAAVADAVREVLADPPDREAVRATVDAYSWERNAAELETHLRRVAGG